MVKTCQNRQVSGVDFPLNQSIYLKFGNPIILSIIWESEDLRFHVYLVGFIPRPVVTSAAAYARMAADAREFLKVPERLGHGFRLQWQSSCNENMLGIYDTYNYIYIYISLTN